MENKLAENQHGHNGIITSHRFHKFKHTLNRITRPFIGKSEIPYDWSNPTPLQTIGIKNQFQAFSCGGEAASYGGQLQLGTPELSAHAFYSQGYAQGGGMTVSSVENVATTRGLNLESEVPSYVDGTTTEAFMESALWRLNPSFVQSALTRTLGTPTNVSIDIENIAEACRDYKFVIFLLQGQNNGTWLTSIPNPPSKTNSSAIWGHYMCGVRGELINNGTQKVIRTLQSWGSTVGDNGYQYLTEEYINSGYIVDIIAFQPKPVVVPPTTIPAPIVVNGVVTNWYQRFVFLLKEFGLYQGN